MLVHNAFQYTGSRLDSLAGELAELLAALGVSACKRVAVCLGNSPAFVVAVLALDKLGCSVFYLSPRSTPAERQDVVARVKPAALLLPGGDRSALLTFPDVATEFSSGQPFSISIIKLAGIDALGSVTAHMTSGVSGRSKISLRPPAAMEDELETFAARLDLGREDATICPCSLAHMYGFVNGLLLPLWSGRPLILADSWLLPNELIRQIRLLRPRVLIGVPVMYTALSRAYGAAADDLASLRICFSAGAPLTRPTVDAFAATFGLPIHQQYGSTETGVIAVNLLEHSEAGPLSVGRPLAGRQVTICTADGEVASGVQGEIVVRGRAVASGYLDDPDEVSRLRDGAFYSGDLGSFDAGFNLHLSGRASAIINVAGLKVDPVEVETVLSSCDAIAECAVLPGTDRSGNEVIQAFVVQRREISVREIQQFCRLRLSAHKVPRLVRFIEALPRTASGKVLVSQLM